jgi:di/tricarboxylate transporter
VLLAVGSLYFLGPGRSLLPRSRVQATLSEHYQVPKFVTEVLVEPASQLINRAVSELEIFGRYDISLLGLIRPQGEASVLAPGPYNRIRSDDILMLQGDPDSILRMRQELGLRERESVKVGDVRLVSTDVQLVEAVVPPMSPLVGRTLSDADFRDTSGLNVLAISKHGDVQPTQIGHTELEVGDTLLLQDHRRDIQRIQQNRTLIVLGEREPPVLGKKAVLTLGLLVAVIATAALTPIHISVAALAGAVGLVLLGCVRAEELRREMDWSVLILIGGMLALGKAFAAHGLDQRVASWMERAGETLHEPVLIVALLLLTTLVLTQVINHVAAAVIMAPVAMSLAAQLGVSDRPLLMAVITGAEFAFMSPVAHQANAMVMGPGDYRYRDFVRVGAPLTVLLGLVAAVILPLFWPFHP